MRERSLERQDSFRDMLSDRLFEDVDRGECYCLGPTDSGDFLGCFRCLGCFCEIALCNSERAMGFGERALCVCEFRVEGAQIDVVSVEPGPIGRWRNRGREGAGSGLQLCEFGELSPNLVELALSNVGSCCGVCGLSNVVRSCGAENLGTDGLCAYGAPGITAG